ncbi:MAG TPA: hypothetical protein VN699_00345 [Pirellulales bacterium]|nr:hypothetical protein [Pirellulales bacterium]
MRPMRGGWVLGAVSLAVVSLAGASGCQSLNPRSVQIDAASGRFQSAQLTYQVDTGRLSQPIQTARIEGQQVSYQQLPSSPLPDRSKARLSVQYPHPNGRAGFALAEVIVEADGRPEKTSSGAGQSTFQHIVGSFKDAMNDILPGMVYDSGVREAWALDVSKEQLDLLVGGLANSGYFQYGPAPTPGIEVFTRLDGKIIRKNWRQVPELDAFIERVRHEGKLVSYVRPASSQGAPADIAGGRNDSVAAYQQQLQRQQALAAPPSQPFPVTNSSAPNQYGQPQPPLQRGPAMGGYQGPPAQSPTAQMTAYPTSAAPPQYGNPAPQPYGNQAAPQYVAQRSHLSQYQPQQYQPQQYGNPPSGNQPPPAAVSPPAQPGSPPPADGQPSQNSRPQAYPQTWPLNQQSARGAYPY